MPPQKAKTVDVTSYDRQFSRVLDDKHLDSSPRLVPVTPQRASARQVPTKESATMNAYKENNRQLALKNAQLLANLKRLNKLAVKLWVQHVADRMKLQSTRQKMQAGMHKELQTIHVYDSSIFPTFITVMS